MADLVAAQAEVASARVEAEEAAAVTRIEAEKTADDEFAVGFF